MNRARLLMLGLGSTLNFVASGCRPAVLPPAHIPAPVATPAPSPAFTPSTTLQPQLISAQPWKPAGRPRDWKWIIIHHTATDRGDVAGIDAAHKRRKDRRGNPWLGIGYHFVIGNGDGMRDGEIEPTFRWKGQMHGAHAGSNAHNRQGIGIALIGNFEKHPPTARQMAAVKRLVSTLKADYRISAKNIVGHRSVKATACPGKYFPLAEVARSDAILLGSVPAEIRPARIPTE